MDQAQRLDIVLASASPRRRELLQNAGIDFRVHAVDVDESEGLEGLTLPEDVVKRLAERKGHAAVEELVDQDYRGDMAVIAADTVVGLDGVIFGKPKDEDDARRMLEQLSGCTHQVSTGVSIWLIHAGVGDDFGIMYRTFVDTAYVTFDELTTQQIDDYLQSGEPFDKAGAYGIQGQASTFVTRLQGSLDTVIGLPVQRLLSDYPDLFA